MRLNPDCVRDILLTVEEEIVGKRFISLPAPSFERLQKYSDEEVFYHVRQCDLAGMLYKVSPIGQTRFLIQDLTPNGHEFLANIRKDTIWNKTKETAASVGSFSLGALTQIATGVVQAMITAHLGIGG